jgi:hypothetical protein
LNSAMKKLRLIRFVRNDNFFKGALPVSLSFVKVVLWFRKKRLFY